MLIKIIRWLKGYVNFIGTGKFPERFINLLNHNGVVYWDVYPNEKGIVGSMAIYDYLRIRKYAKRSSVKLKITRKNGLPIFVNKYKHRKGLLIGAVCGLLIMCFLSQYVWVVDIKGVNNLSYTEVKQAVENSGLKVGAYKNNLDVGKIERDIILEIPQIGWMAVNCLNNVATVEIKEKAQKPKIEKAHYPCNLCATADGVVTKSTVSQGTSQVIVGSAVTKNQILVSCVVEKNDESVDYVHSKGEIFADVIGQKTLSINKSKSIIEPDYNYNEKSNLQFWWFSLPFEMYADSNQSFSIWKNEQLKINDVVLPIGVTTQKIYNYKIYEEDVKDFKNILLKKYALWELFNETHSNFISRDINYTQTEENYSITVNYVVNKNIVKKQKVQIHS